MLVEEVVTQMSLSNVPMGEEMACPPSPRTALLVASAIMDPFLACVVSKVLCNEIHVTGGSMLGR